MGGPRAAIPTRMGAFGSFRVRMQSSQFADGPKFPRIRIRHRSWAPAAAPLRAIEFRPAAATILFVQSQRGPADFQGPFRAVEDDAAEIHSHRMAARIIHQEPLGILQRTAQVIRALKRPVVGVANANTLDGVSHSIYQ